MKKGKVAILVKPGEFKIEEREIYCGDDEVIVQVASVGLCNWEKGFFTGVLEGAPCTLGHEWGGIIVECGKKVTKWKEGDRVSIFPDDLSGFAQYANIKADNCFRVADDVDIYEAFAEPLKCVVTTVRSAAPEAGDYGVMIGCGPMGLWCTQLLSGNTLAGLIAVDIDDLKLEFAKKCGATHVINPLRENVLERIAEITDGHLADFVIEGTGSPKQVMGAASYLRKGRGRLVLMSYYERNLDDYDFRIAADKGAIITNPQPAFSADQLDDTRRAIALLNRKTFRMEGIITHRFDLDDIQTAFETIVNKPAGYIKGIVICNKGLK